MLDELGLFLGRDLEANHESMFFQKTNDWALRYAGASWDNPEAIKHVLRSPEHVRLSTEYMQMRVDGWGWSCFWGLPNYVRHCIFGRELARPWGWKDPRTIFTLPLWGQIFPSAKVIYIQRNGVSVAASLRARENKMIKQAGTLHRWRKQFYAYSLREKKGGFSWSPRCMQLSEGFALWEEYVSEAEKNLQTSGFECFDIRYEDFLKAPTESLGRMARFCGLIPSEDGLARLAATCRTKRADAFLNDPELAAFYDSVKDRPLMRKLGYSYA